MMKSCLPQIDGQLLSHLVGEVSEFESDEMMLSSVYELKASSQKFKTSFTENSCKGTFP
jgi:hypothetical protein